MSPLDDSQPGGVGKCNVRRFLVKGVPLTISGEVLKQSRPSKKKQSKCDLSLGLKNMGIQLYVVGPPSFVLWQTEDFRLTVLVYYVLPLFPVELLFPSSLSQGLLVAVHLTTSQGERIQYCQSSTENNYWWYWYLHLTKNIQLHCRKAAPLSWRAVTKLPVEPSGRWPLGQIGDNGYQCNKNRSDLTIFESFNYYFNISPWQPANGVLMSQSEPSCTKGKALEAACRLGSFVGICSLGDLEKRAQIGQESVHVHTIYYIRGSVKL